MDSKWWYPAVLALICLLFVILALWFRPTDRSLVEGQTQRKFQRLQIDKTVIEVVISDTPAQIQQGLSDRTTIGADGMWFVLPQKYQATFWMLRMQFDLDVVWVADGVVVDLHERIPHPSTDMTEPARMTPKQSVTHVLEVPAGFISQHSIQKGQKVQILDVATTRLW